MLAHQTAYTLGWILLPLQLATTDARSVAWVLAANALGVAAGATALGWLGGRIGGAIGLAALAGAAALAVPQTFTSDATVLAALRFAFGFCVGGVLPSLRAAVAESAEDKTQLGLLYGVAQSAVAAGGVIGAPMASVVAAQWGIASVHIASAVVFATAALGLAPTLRQPAIRHS
jgi:MFS family permease